MKVRISVIVNFIIFVLLLSVYFVSQKSMNINLDECSRILSYISFALIIWYIILLYTNKFDSGDFRLYFIITNMVFIMGHLWIHFFGQDEYITWKLLFRADTENIYRGGMYALCFNQAMVSGLFLSSKSSYMRIIEKRSDRNKVADDVLYKSGLVVFLTLLPLNIYYNINYVRTAISVGRYVASDGITVNGMVYCLGIVSFTGLFYIICSKRVKLRNIVILLSGVFVYLAVIMMITGDRRFPVIAILCILLCVIKTYNVRFRKPTIVLIAVLVYLFIIALNVISSTRRSGVLRIGDFISMVFQEAFSFDMAWKTMAEFGITLFTYVYAIQYFPSRFPFRYGSQLLVNIIGVLPVGGFIAQWMKDTGIQTAVNNITGQPIGGSLGADLYGNFSFLGLFGGIVAGWLINRIMQNRKSILTRYDAAKYYSLFYIMLNLVRAGFSEIIRLGFYSYFVPIVVCYLLSGRWRK